MIRRRARVLAMCVVVSMLAASLPASSASMQGSGAANESVQSSSLPAQFFRGVSQGAASIGTWVTSVFSSTSSKTIEYQPVAAYISPAPPFIDAPTNLTATAASASSVSLSWTAPAGSVDHYQVERATNIEGPFFFLTNVGGGTTTHSDNTVTNLQAYLYRVRAVTNLGLPSAPSNMALGTAISFQFANPQGQEIKAQHSHDVRTAINSVRAIGNLTAATWAPRTNLLGLQVLASDVNELRTKLDEALTALGIPVTAYTDPTLQTGANGTLIKAAHIQELQTRSTKGSSTSFGPIDSDSSTARLDPLNETGGGGENPLSRNFNWNLPFLRLPGRAELDLSLTLSYNSLVWTRSGNTISFDDDNGFPGPGFRLGFPVIQQLYYNTTVGKQAFLLIHPDGSRTELRRVGATNLYEAADSSYLLLDAAAMVLRGTDGTQSSYVLIGSEFKCTQIKDRNGNYITINYNASGQIDNIHDTLDRVITFIYDDGWLSPITQAWKRPTNPSESITHTWATFSYANLPIQTNFSGVSVFGPSNGTAIKVLTKVTLDDNSTTPTQNSYFTFDYTSFGQVWKISNFAADNHLRNYRSYRLPGSPLWASPPAQTDCPRFTERRDWAEKWNQNAGGTEQEVLTSFSAPQAGSANVPGKAPQSATFVEVTNPNGTSTRFYFLGTGGTSSGWQVGLEYLLDSYDCLDANPTNPCSNPVLVRQIETTWTRTTKQSRTPLIRALRRQTSTTRLEADDVRRPCMRHSTSLILRAAACLS